MKGSVFAVDFGFGAGPCSLALWNADSISFMGYLQSISHCFNTSNRYFSLFELEVKTMMRFARVKGMLCLM